MATGCEDSTERRLQRHDLCNRRLVGHELRRYDVEVAFPQEEAVFHHFWIHPVGERLRRLDEKKIPVLILQLDLA